MELSQRQLAALVGVGKTTIGEIERGERLPNVVTAIRIAKALHTTVEELWSEDYYGQETDVDGTDPPVVGIGHGGAAAGPLHGGAVHSVRAAAESQTLGILAREGRRDRPFSFLKKYV